MIARPFLIAAFGCGTLLLVAAGLNRRLQAADPTPVNVMWRFDGNGHFPNIHPPAKWATDKNILWKTTVDAGAYSSPIVVGNRVFVTAEMGSLICLDISDGKILWQKDLFSKDSKDIPPELSAKLMRGCGGDAKGSTPTPASNGKLVFYINAMGLCACYDLDGHQQWIRIIETAQDEEHFTASPAFVGDRIIVSWGCLLALSPKDGHTLWKAADAKGSHGTPAMAKIGDEEVAVTPAGAIVKLANGEILCSGLFESTYATPLIEGNVIYVIDRKAQALELPARAEKGMRLKQVWSSKLHGDFMASPMFKDGLIYTIDSRKHRLLMIDAKTGESLTSSNVLDDETKTEKVEPGVKIDGLTPANYLYASPVEADKKVFVFDDAGNAAVLEFGRTYKFLHANKLNDAIAGTPFFYKDKIIIRGSETVYCVGEKH
jgi:outer membrane protein assembly factor BamB